MKRIQEPKNQKEMKEAGKWLVGRTALVRVNIVTIEEKKITEITSYIDDYDDSRVIVCFKDGSFVEWNELNLK